MFSLLDPRAVRYLFELKRMQNSSKVYSTHEMSRVVRKPAFYIYYSNFDKDQFFIFVCRRSCLSNTKHFMINMKNNYHSTNMITFVCVFSQLFLHRYKNHHHPLKLKLRLIVTFSNFVICLFPRMHRTAFNVFITELLYL